ncbi:MULTISPECIES: M60 family metallopeptidase [Burkholderia]|uniref:M60 family metallopeptidase n=1 Tax=Burkholderia TaxID=32008 RepID=UPI000B7A8A7E|nr:MULTISPECIES: M60 family metallopeptidase [Burkholderia]OXI96962.1 hypothetical protein CFB41_28435 [Burkholderia sp. AU33803]PRD92449.1 hypothetical protein C6P88_15165 [Burkholderia contaminans]
MKQHRSHRKFRANIVIVAIATSSAATTGGAAPVPAHVPDVCGSSLREAGDPLDVKRAHRRALLASPVQSTGFWAARDTALTINVTYCGPPPNRATEVWIESIARAGDPAFARQRHVLREGQNVVPVKNDGVIYFVMRSERGRGQVSARLVSGGRAFPRFVLGKDRASDWSAILNRGSGEPYAELVGRRMMLTMPLAVVREHVDNPEQVLSRWDEIVTLAEQQYGLGRDAAYPSMATPFRHHFVTQPDAMPGDMSASDYWLGTRVDRARPVLNAAELVSHGWVAWTQLGHHYRIPAMTWDTQQAAMSHLTALYVQRALAQPSRLVTDRVWDKVRAHLDRPGGSYDTLGDPLVRAAMLWQLDLAFGRDFHARLGQRYRTLPVAELPVADDRKRQAFIIETSRVAGRNLLPFFDKWGLRANAQTRAILAASGLPALDKPIWDNTDDAVTHTYGPLEQAPAGRIVMPKSVIPGQGFTVQAEVANATGRSPQYAWTIPAGFHTSGGREGASITLIAPATALPGAFAPIRVTVTVTVAGGGVATTLGGSIQLLGDGAALHDAMMQRVYGNGTLRQWNSERRGTVGDLYVYSNPYRMSRDYFRLLTAQYDFFPTSGTSNASWRYLGSYGGETYSASQAYDLKMLAEYRKPAMRAWDGAKVGVSGDIYGYDNPYRSTRDYFRLINANYGYFPTDWSSNADWQYLGSYDGEQFAR